jgi:hypothetical protein
LYLLPDKYIAARAFQADTEMPVNQHRRRSDDLQSAILHGRENYRALAAMHALSAFIGWNGNGTQARFDQPLQNLHLPGSEFKHSDEGF